MEILKKGWVNGQMSIKQESLMHHIICLSKKTKGKNTSKCGS